MIEKITYFIKLCVALPVSCENSRVIVIYLTLLFFRKDGVRMLICSNTDAVPVDAVRIMYGVHIKIFSRLLFLQFDPGDDIHPGRCQCHNHIASSK